jgi:hypothetical protein
MVRVGVGQIKLDSREFGLKWFLFSECGFSQFSITSGGSLRNTGFVERDGMDKGLN